MNCDRLVVMLWMRSLSCGPVDLELDDLGRFAVWWLRTYGCTAMA